MHLAWVWTGGCVDRGCGQGNVQLLLERILLTFYGDSGIKRLFSPDDDDVFIIDFIITILKQSYGKAMFSQISVILSTGGGGGVCTQLDAIQMDVPLLDATQMDAPPWMHPHEDRRSSGGRYASYWNVYLFLCLHLRTVTLVTIEPIYDDIKCLCHCRQVRTVPNVTVRRVLTTL